MKNDVRTHRRARSSYPSLRKETGNTTRAPEDQYEIDFIFVPTTNPMKGYGLLVVATIGPPIRARGKDRAADNYIEEPWSVQDVVVLDASDRRVPWSVWSPHSEAIRTAVHSCMRTMQ